MSHPREIIFHEVLGAMSGIKVTADERNPANGNASHKYMCTWADNDNADMTNHVHIQFQDGPIKEHGINGITNEILLAMVIDRLEGFQTSKFACDENAEALASLNHALNVLQLRTRRRVDRGVEGTHIE